MKNKEHPYIKGHTNEKYLYELCPNCEQEIKIKNKFEKQICPNCKKTILPCCLCDMNIADCSKCPLEKKQPTKQEYEIGVVEISYGFVKIKAFSLEEAKEMAKDKVNNGMGIFTGGNLYLENEVDIIER